ncbi:MAG: hypothetical protein L0177_04785 [Chloroflexi bacterium]|nr:hypothetical protein [Chloroflexota bacterium]
MLVTRIVSALVVPFVAAAFVVLYLLPYPDGVTRNFAWTIRPQMSAMLMGAGYMAGAYYFARATVAREWHHVALGFPGITAFTTLAAIATILHWDNFIHGHTPFYIWVVLYAITPFLVPAVWLINRRTDPGTFDSNDRALPALVRWAAGAAGALVLAITALFLFAPGFMIDIWPWQLSETTSRTGAAWFSLFGVVAITVPFERRWSGVRITLQSLMLAVALFLIAAIRAWGEFDKGNPLTWVFVVGLAVGLAAIATLYAFMSRRPA